MKSYYFILIILFLVFLLYLWQDKLIFFPQKYSETELQQSKNFVIQLSYKTSAGKQTAFYLPPQAIFGDSPSKIWIVFGGNATLALHWLDFVANFPDKSVGFLLIEYPGYGLCEGNPTPESIRESSQEALKTLAQHLNRNQVWINERIYLLGHSLGAASALQFAVEHPPQKIVLLSSFTTLQDMACRAVGIPLCYLLRYRFDNISRLREISQNKEVPDIYLFHGSRDEVIPVSMGRKLADTFSEFVQYREIENADHNFILFLAEQQIFEAMQK